MTSTNRILNRLFLAVTGVITLAAGIGLVLVALPGDTAVRSSLSSARDVLARAIHQTPLTGFGGVARGSYLPLLLAVICLVVVVVAIVAAVTRGGGRINRIIDSDETGGRIEISSRFAETAVVDALAERRDVASVSVASYRLKGSPALKVRLRVTAGSSPRPAVDAASQVVGGLDRVLGERTQIPVLVEVTGASPVRPGADSRVN